VWRIRNLPFPRDYFDVRIHNSSEIIVRTSNKKYFKRFDIPDMKRKGLVLEASSLSWNHLNNTLIINYKKPAPILIDEEVARKERTNIKAEKEGDCAMQ